jgi:hypothetical protein
MNDIESIRKTRGFVLVGGAGFGAGAAVSTSAVWPFALAFLVGNIESLTNTSGRIFEAFCRNQSLCLRDNRQFASVLGSSPKASANAGRPMLCDHLPPGTLQVETYAPRGHDPQRPHIRDEAYIVIQG